MRRPSLFVLVYSVLVIVPFISILAGVLDFEKMGFTAPSTPVLLASVFPGVVCVPVSYAPVHLILTRRDMRMPWLEQSRTSFLRMLPFLVSGAIVEEFFFRGFVTSMTLPLGAIPAIGISSTAHYLAHFLNPGFSMLERAIAKMVGGVGWFLTSAVITSVFIFGRSLVPAIVLHVIASVGFGLLITARASSTTEVR